MGKKGDLLRQQKKQKAVYTFTGEELAIHDKQVALAYLQKCEGIARDMDRKREEEFRRKANEVWDERTRMFQGGDETDNLMAYLRCFFAISCRVLVEQFGWKVPRTRGRNTNLMRFATGLAEEIDRITGDERYDIVKYAREVYDKYGVGFQMEDVDGDD